MNSRFKLVVVTSSTFLVVLLLLGAVMGQSASPEEPYRQLSVYSEVLSRIKSEYVEEPDIKNVTLGAMNGLLESIDPFASYLSAEQYKQFLKTHDAKKAGVGLVLSRKFGYVGVVNAIPGSSAAKAGLGYRRHAREHRRHSDSRYAAGVCGDAASGRYWNLRGHHGLARP